MDPPTHGLIGAAIGQGFFGRSLGTRAVAWGAVLSMLPDIDVVVVPLGGELAEWKYHRAATHGLWFGPVVGAALGWALWRWRGRAKGAPPAGPGPWIALAIVSLLAHAIADAFTSYGTLLLWPSSRRFAWDALPIVDVLFSAALLSAVLVGRMWRRPRTAQVSALAALGFCVAWEGYGLLLNRRAEAEARRQLEAAGLFRSRGMNPRSLFELGDSPVPQTPRLHVRAYPVLLQPWLRRLVVRAEASDLVGVGWISMWRPAPVRWHFFRPANGPEVEAARRLADVRFFEWFAMGQTTAGIRPAAPGLTVEFDDLRYGPPTDPEHGLWGVRATIGASGEPLGEVQRIRRPPPPMRLLLPWLWASTFEQGGASGAPP
jgi:inner membrane protein